MYGMLMEAVPLPTYTTPPPDLLIENTEEPRYAAVIAVIVEDPVPVKLITLPDPLKPPRAFVTYRLPFRFNVPFNILVVVLADVAVLYVAVPGVIAPVVPNCTIPLL